LGTENRTYSGGAIGTCLCNSYFYDDLSNEFCPPCDHTCNTCNGTASNNCLSCGVNVTTHRTLTTGSCPCDFGYYDNGSTLNCT